jgi:hypothetical protein
MRPRLLRLRLPNYSILLYACQWVNLDFKRIIELSKARHFSETVGGGVWIRGNYRQDRGHHRRITRRVWLT